MESRKAKLRHILETFYIVLLSYNKATATYIVLVEQKKLTVFTEIRTPFMQEI